MTDQNRSSNGKPHGSGKYGIVVVNGLFLIAGAIVTGVLARSGSISILIPPEATPTQTAPLPGVTKTVTATPATVSQGGPVKSGKKSGGTTPKLHKVTLGQLCNGGSDIYICGTDYGGTVPLDDQTFPYKGETNGWAEPPDWAVLLSFPKNTCERLRIEFAMSNDETRPGEIGRLQLIQSNHDPAQKSTQRGKYNVLSAKLNGSPWTLRGNTDGGKRIYARGYAWCRTDSGT